MSKYRRCEICGKFGWTDKHRCPPIWMVFEIDETGSIDYQREVYASSPESAAIDFADLEDTESADFLFLNDGGKVGVFRKDEPENIFVYAITGEMIPQYDADMVDVDDAVLSAIKEELST